MRPSRPNILLIVSEDNGPHLGCYGDPYVRTPTLDRLASEGVRFENAYTTHPVCSPARASILTGLYPHQNGQISLATHRYAMFENFPNLASILGDDGYRTGIMGKLHVNPSDAFPFDFIWRSQEHLSFAHRDVREVADAAGGFFSDSDQPFFLMVNYADCHFPLLDQQHGVPEVPMTGEDVTTLPFIGADSDRLREGTASYYNCQMRIDKGVELMLQQLEAAGKAEDTLIIYAVDHGAQFSRGKATCYEGGLRVPLIIHWKHNVNAGSTVEQMASHIDLLPTILEAAGVECPDGLPGQSLLPLARGEDVEWRRHIFAQRTSYSANSYFPQRTVRDERYKLIWNPVRDRSNPVYSFYLEHVHGFFEYGTSQEDLGNAPEHVQRGYATWKSPPLYELYDLEADPWEFTDLSGSEAHKEIKDRLAAVLSQWQVDTLDPLRKPEILEQLTAEHDRVVEQFPNAEYRKDETFRWNYLDYCRPQ